MNQKNSLGLNNCFLDEDDPISLFKAWMDEAKKTEPNDPNAVSLATSNNNNFPSVRIVLLKDFSQNGFVFYTNFKSQKGNELKENPKAAMCFHWKSLLRQIRITGKVTQVSNQDADQYYNSRAYDSRIGAWASKQSEELKSRDQLMNSIKEYKNNGVKVGFCGQQPSDSLEFCNFLINEGIDSISVIPDSAIKTINNLGYL